MDELLILGIDPGSTVGFSVLNLDGDLLLLDSLKNVDLNSVVIKARDIGKVFIIGTDVNPAPKAVSKVAINYGATVIEPKEDLQIRYKRKLVNEFLRDKDVKIRNKHELDALAASILAYKHYQPLFNKIVTKLNSNDKIHLTNKVRDLVLKENLSIKRALESVS